MNEIPKNPRKQLPPRWREQRKLRTRWSWRIHLSTALVLTLITGAFLGLNLRRTPRTYDNQTFGFHRDEYSAEYIDFQFRTDGYFVGWPLNCIYVYDTEGFHFDGDLEDFKAPRYMVDWYFGLPINALILVATCLILGIISERRARRRVEGERPKWILWKLWNLHRATKVLLLFAIGLIVWRGSIPRYSDNSPITYTSYGDQYGHCDYGWPLPLFSVFAELRSEKYLMARDDANTMAELRKDSHYVPGLGIVIPYNEGRAPRAYSYAGIGVDLVSCSALLLLLAATSERCIRRRERLRTQKVAEIGTAAAS